MICSLPRPPVYWRQQRWSFYVPPDATRHLVPSTPDRPLCALLMLPVPGAAQTVTGTIQGTVTDTTGGAVPGATVTIQNLDTNRRAR